MTSDRKFYVYVHRKATDGTVFYVGKGCGKRDFNSKQRSSRWNNIANKYGFTAHIVMRFDKEICAFSFEKALIRYYGRENLCNHTNGGEGISGLRHSEEAKAKMSAAKKVIGVSDEIISALKNSRIGKKNSEQHNKKISIANKGRKRNEDERKKMSIRRIGKYTGKENPVANKKEYTFYHEYHGFFIGAPVELRDFYNLTGGSVGRIVNGVRKSFKGWVIIK